MAYIFHISVCCQYTLLLIFPSTSYHRHREKELSQKKCFVFQTTHNYFLLDRFFIFFLAQKSPTQVDNVRIHPDMFHQCPDLLGLNKMETLKLPDILHCTAILCEITESPFFLHKKAFQPLAV